MTAARCDPAAATEYVKFERVLAMGGPLTAIAILGPLGRVPAVDTRAACTPGDPEFAYPKSVQVTKYSVPENTTRGEERTFVLSWYLSGVKTWVDPADRF
jgi:hypothetical protein